MDVLYDYFFHFHSAIHSPLVHFPLHLQEWWGHYCGRGSTRSRKSLQHSATFFLLIHFPVHLPEKRGPLLWQGGLEIPQLMGHLVVSTPFPISLRDRARNRLCQALYYAHNVFVGQYINTKIKGGPSGAIVM